MLGVVLPWFLLGTAAISVSIARAATEATRQHLAGARLEHLGQALSSLLNLRARLAQMQGRRDDLQAELPKVIAYHEWRVRRYQSLLLHKAITQFVTEAWWGEPDFLLVDMPPGTGDVALTLSEVVPSVEVYVVTTPQPAAQRVAQRSALAARKLRQPVRGVVENMSAFEGADGTRYELFGRGGGEALAADLGVPLLAQLPFVVAIREGGDDGVPVTVADPGGPAGEAFRALATRVAAQGPARVYRQELRLG